MNREGMLRDFEDYLIVERQLGEKTVERHIFEIRRLFKTSEFNPLEATI